MLLYGSNFSLRLFGQDIDPLVVKIACINGALYAPWLAFPLPERLFTQPPAQLPEAPNIENTPFRIHEHQSFAAGARPPSPFILLRQPDAAKRHSRYLNETNALPF